MGSPPRQFIRHMLIFILLDLSVADSTCHGVPS
jgi:hypothetical protein